MIDPHILTKACQVEERLGLLAKLSDEEGGTTRTFLSPAMGQANRCVGSWMEEVGLEIGMDAWGNLKGSWRVEDDNAPVLILGSHLDTVRNAGKYDGPMGVLLSLAAIDVLKQKGTQLPFHVDIFGFSDEEGVRFQTTYLGSRAVLGLIQPEDLSFKDRAGISLQEAVSSGEGSKISLPLSQYKTKQVLGYLEVHLEQGPILEEQNYALGVVTDVAAQTRLRYVFTGKAAHAGTTPMALRQDALAGAAEFILGVENLALAQPGLVATVGQLSVLPGASNVIPQEVQLTVDVRHAEEKMNQQMAREKLPFLAEKVGRERRLQVQVKVVQETSSAQFAPAWIERLAASVAKVQDHVPRLVSGAGHDAVVFSSIVPTAMLFVRCRAGLSHHPDESVAVEDMAMALQVLVDVLEGITR